MRALRIAAVALPVIVGIVAAIVVAAGGHGGTLRIAVSVETLVVVTGLALSAIVAGVLWGVPAAARRRSRAYVQGRVEGERAERDGHRRFLARLDHELKNPVTAIRTALAAEQGDEATPNLAVAAGQADRLAALVGELRSLSSLETHELERESVDVDAVMREEVDAVRDELRARGILREFHVDLPTAPWPLPRISGDPDLLALALRNLLINAAKYSDDGARIEVRGSEDAGGVVIEVADTGWGIAADELAQVWDELWRGGSARRVEGSGLGLSLVRIVAARHGGDVAIRSHLGTGTSVRMRLPAQ